MIKKSWPYAGARPAFSFLQQAINRRTQPGGSVNARTQQIGALEGGDADGNLRRQGRANRGRQFRANILRARCPDCGFS